MGVKERTYWLDYIRVFACFLVIVVHLPSFNTPLSIVYTSVSRIAVPLFFMISGYLTLPVNHNDFKRTKNRILRILVPFLVWWFFYCSLPFLYGEVTLIETIKSFPFVLVSLSAPHLWYIYGMIGLYLIAPVISPWLEIASEKGLLYFLVFWAITLFFPVVKLLFPFVKMNEWSSIFILKIFQGYLGYYILGFYVKKYLLSYPSRIINILIPAFYSFGILFLAFVGFYLKKPFITTIYNTPNVAFMAIATILLMSKVKIHNDGLNKLISQLSIYTFGVYLIHGFISKNIVLKYFDISFVGVHLQRPFCALLVFIISTFLVFLLSKLPYSKYIIG